MKKVEWTVRVVVLKDLVHDVLAGAVRRDIFWLTEGLRYPGYTRVLQDNDARVVAEFYCPNKRGLDTKAWAEHNAARWRSFGVMASAAPVWDGHSTIELPRLTAENVNA